MYLCDENKSVVRGTRDDPSSVIESPRMRGNIINVYERRNGEKMTRTENRGIREVIVHRSSSLSFIMCDPPSLGSRLYNGTPQEVMSARDTKGVRNVTGRSESLDHKNNKHSN